MSDAKDVYNRHVAAFNAKDAEADPWHADAVFVAPGAQLRGRDEVSGYMRVFWEAFPDAHIELARVIAEGPLLAAEGMLSGTHTGTLRSPDGEIPPTGRRVEFRWSGVFETRGEELLSEHLYFDQLDLLTQLGLAGSSAEATTAAH